MDRFKEFAEWYKGTTLGKQPVPVQVAGWFFLFVAVYIVGYWVFA